MHEFFMEHYGNYLKEHYSDLDSMSVKDLCEAKKIAKTMKCIFDADTQYNIVKAMEEHDDNSNVEMTWDEFVARFKKMYSEATTSEQLAMKTQISTIIA